MRTASFIVAGSLLAAVPAAAQTVPPVAPPALTYTQQLSPQAALVRFQQTHGLQVTGQLNEATVATLGLSPDQLLTASRTPAPLTAPVAGNTLSAAGVRAVQARLQALNYYHGNLDGVWGGETQSAIERFQEGRGLQPTGQLNPATITALGLDPSVLTPAG